MSTPTARPGRRGGRREKRAFTLIEMLIAIGVVILLTAITVSAVMALTRSSEKSQTENTIRLLDMALKEWEDTTDRKITWGSRSTSDMADNVAPHVYTVTEVLATIRHSAGVRDVIEFAEDDIKEKTGLDIKIPFDVPDAE